MEFVKVGNKTISAEELCRLLGLTPTIGLPITIGQSVSDGTMVASMMMGDPENCPSVDVEFHRDGDVPMLLSHTEQSEGETLRTFLYDRADSYVAYLTHDIRPDEELGDDVLDTDLVASGDRDVTVHVYRENQFAISEGDLCNKYPAEESC